MPRNKHYPSLSHKGWIESPDEILDSAMSNYFVSYSSENTNSTDYMYTLQEIIQKYAGSIDDIRTNIQTSLTTILLRYFPTAAVDVRTEYPFPNDETRVGIVVSATIRTETNVAYDLCKSVSVENSKVIKIMKVNNDG